MFLNFLLPRRLGKMLSNKMSQSETPLVIGNAIDVAVKNFNFLLRRVFAPVLIFSLSIAFFQNSFAANPLAIGATGEKLVKMKSIVRLDGLGQAVKAKLEASGVHEIFKETTENGQIVYRFYDKTDKVIRELVVGSKASQEYYKQFAPTKIRAYFNELKSTAGSIASHKLMEFPLEAMTFFVALGALSTKDLILNYNTNPAALDQLLKSQADPIGQLGFMAFMQANGFVSQPLMAIGTSARTRVFIPYLGMTAGMMASNIVHEVAHVPGLMKCAASVGTNAKACDEAYEAWLKTDMIDKLNEWAPQLFGMLMSTAASGVIELGIKSAGGKVLQMAGVEVALLATGTGAVITGLRWAWKVGQIAMFIYLDPYFTSPATFWWKSNVSLRPRLEKLSKELLDQPNEKEIREYNQKMQAWRQAVLETVMTANANWEQYLSRFSSQYLVARTFYQDFISHLWSNKFKYQKPGLINFNFPLLGITPDGLKKENENRYLFDPGFVEKAQLITIANLTSKLESDPQFQVKVATLSEADQKTWKTLFNQLKSGDRIQIGSAFWSMRMLTLKETSLKPQPASQKLQEILNQVMNQAGSPDPQFGAGQGYLKLMTKYAQEGLYQASPFEGSLFNHAVMNSTLEELVFRMISGPEVGIGKLGSTVLTLPNGFPAEFYPPRVHNQGEFFTKKILNRENLPISYLNSIFNYELHFKNEKENKGNNQTMLSFLMNDGIDPQILQSENGTGIAKWWINKVEPDYVSAWLSFEKKYQKNTVELFKILSQKDESRCQARGYKHDCNPGGLRQNPLQSLNEQYQFLKNVLIKHYSFNEFTEIDQKFSEAQALFLQLKLEKDVTGEYIVVGEINNALIKEIKEGLSQSVQEWAKNMTKDNGKMLNDSQKLKQFEALSSGIVAVFDEMTTYAQILNATSYTQNHEDGKFVKKRCVSQVTKNMLGTILNKDHSIEVSSDVCERN